MAGEIPFQFETGSVCTAASDTLSTVDALIALQGVENPAERKKRAVAKGRKALDVLDTLKLSLLDGSVDGGTLARLKVAAEGLGEQTGDPGLDTVLSEIEPERRPRESEELDRVLAWLGERRNDSAGLRAELPQDLRGACTNAVVIVLKRSGVDGDHERGVGADLCQGIRCLPAHVSIRVL